MRNIFKLLCLFLVLAVFTNCQKDDLKETEARQFGPNLSPYKYVYGEDALKIREKLRVAATNKKINISGLNGHKSDGWDVDFNEVMVMKDSTGRETYTCRITHPDMAFNQFYNLSFSEDENNDTSILVVRYTMTPGFASRLQSGQADPSGYEGSITFTPVNGGPLIRPGLTPPPNPQPEPPTPPTTNPCGEEVTIRYPSPGNGGVVPAPPGTVTPAPPGPTPPGGGGPAGSDLSFTDCFEIMYVMCSENRPGHYGGNGGACTAPLKGATYLINKCKGTVTQTKSNGGRQIVFDPCGRQPIGVLFPDYLAGVDNCKELNDLSQKTPFNDKMNELKTKAGTQNFESAYVMYDVGGANGISFSNEFKGSTSNPEVAINLTSPTQPASNSTVVVHCHLDNIPTYKVLTFDDIIVLGEICKASTKPGTKLGVYVTTAAGNFAIKPTNRVELRNKLDLFNMTHDSYIKDFKEYLETTNTTEQQILGLLNFIKDRIGEIIDLYQQKPNGTWQRLSLSSNGKSIVRTDC